MERVRKRLRNQRPGHGVNADPVSSGSSFLECGFPHKPHHVSSLSEVSEKEVDKERKRCSAGSQNLSPRSDPARRYETFQKRKRHKTCVDRYDPAPKRKQHVATHRSTNRKKKHKEKATRNTSKKAGEDLMQNFASGRITNDRLTASLL